MTALDQAFIKAFSQQQASPVVLPPAPPVATAPTPSASPKKAKRRVSNATKPANEKPNAKPRRAKGEARVQKDSSGPWASLCFAVGHEGVALKEPPRPVATSQAVTDVFAALELQAQTREQRPSTKPTESNEGLASAVDDEAVLDTMVPPSSPPAAVPIATLVEDARVDTAIELPAEPKLPPRQSAPISPCDVDENVRYDPPPLESWSSGAARGPWAMPDPTVLVSHTVGAATARREFRPAWQVEQFTWPRVCRRLIARAAEELDRLADALLGAHAQGRTVLAMAGCRRDEGATTLLLCTARRLAERGAKVVLVDADLARPRLAKRLGVQAQLGWNQTSPAEDPSLDQAVVEAATNNLALVPARELADESDRPAGDPARLASCLGELREHYDLVLVDPGPLDSARLSQSAGAIDAVVLVHNRRITSEDQRIAVEGQLAVAGLAVVGIIENFVPEE
jgi:Mrp family chromosome partitioning ATPase